MSLVSRLFIGSITALVFVTQPAAALPTGVAPPTYFPNGLIKGVNGLAAAAVASDLTTLLGYVPLNPANNLTDVANPATALAILGGCAKTGCTFSGLVTTSYSGAMHMVRNTSDLEGTFYGDSWDAGQLGMYNPSASAVGVIAPGQQLTMFAWDKTGRVGSATNTYNAAGGVTFRNLLDDGLGNARITGTMTMPSVTIAQTFVSGGCTPTSYFTLQDSSGTSHKVPVC